MRHIELLKLSFECSYLLALQNFLFLQGFDFFVATTYMVVELLYFFVQCRNSRLKGDPLLPEHIFAHLCGCVLRRDLLQTPLKNLSSGWDLQGLKTGDDILLYTLYNVLIVLIFFYFNQVTSKFFA